uniref:Uncharacterized protein n=1 Tax=Oryza meridionalis TaxID=40149 RepID=A0A0E0CKP8_9ORYZ
MKQGLREQQQQMQQTPKPRLQGWSLYGIAIKAAIVHLKHDGVGSVVSFGGHEGLGHRGMAWHVSGVLVLGSRSSRWTSTPLTIQESVK